MDSEQRGWRDYALFSKLRCSQDFCFKRHILGDVDRVRWLHSRKGMIKSPEVSLAKHSSYLIRAEQGLSTPSLSSRHLPHPCHPVYLHTRAQDSSSEHFYCSLANIFIFVWSRPEGSTLWNPAFEITLYLVMCCNHLARWGLFGAEDWRKQLKLFLRRWVEFMLP